MSRTFKYNGYFAFAPLALGIAGTAAANVMTFEAAPLNGGPPSYSEAGFTLTGLVFNNRGNPGKSLGADLILCTTTGQNPGPTYNFSIVASDAGNFRFSGLDYAVLSKTAIGRSVNLDIFGLSGGNVVGTSRYTVAATNYAGPAVWKSFDGGSLAGIAVDNIKFTFSGAELTCLGPVGDLSFDYGRLIDNIRLDPIVDTPAVPEPATWALAIAGFALIGGAARRKRATALSLV